MIRLTEGVRQQLLDVNEGFRRSTYYSGKNSSVTTVYTVRGGELWMQESGKGAWADSRYSNKPYVASDEQTHRFLRKYYDELDWTGVVQTPAVRRPRPDVPSAAALAGAGAGDDGDESEDSEDALERLKGYAGLALLGIGALYLAGEAVWSHGIKPRIEKRRAARAARQAEASSTAAATPQDAAETSQEGLSAQP